MLRIREENSILYSGTAVSGLSSGPTVINRQKHAAAFLEFHDVEHDLATCFYRLRIRTSVVTNDVRGTTAATRGGAAS